MPTPLSLSYDALRVITRAAPEVPERAGNPSWFPPGGAPYLNIIIGADGPVDEAYIWRSTIVGNSAASHAVHCVDRADLFGDGVLRFGDYVDSLSAFGSLAAQWLGLQPMAGESMSDAMRRTLHEFCKEPTDPDLTDPAWDAYGLETANPGLRAKLAAVTPATSKADNEDNAFYGRNSGLHMIKGRRNTIIGKNALAHGWYNNEVTAIGWGAVRNGALVFRSVFAGSSAGLNWSEGENNVVIGPDAALSVTRGNNNVIIGPDAAHGHSGAVNSLLSISTGTDRPPLISGSFGGGYVGVNIDRGDILATGLHVRVGDGGTGGEVNPAASGIVLEQSEGHGGMTILTRGDAIGQVAFTRPGDPLAGSIRYAHATDEMQFRAGGDAVLRLRNGRMGFFGASPTVKPTGVPKTVAGIHAALIELNLIAG